MTESKKPSFSSLFSKLKNSGKWLDLAIGLAFSLICLVFLSPFFHFSDETNAFSAPLIPAFSYLLSQIFRIDIQRAISLALLFFFFWSPLVFYFFVIRLTRRRMTGFWACAFYLLPYWWFLKSRLQMAFIMGDGAHLAAFSLFPLVSLSLLRFLRKGNFIYLVLTSLSVSILALISPFGLLVGVIILTVITFSEVLLGQGRMKLVRFSTTFLLAIAFSAFWYNPAFVRMVITGPQGRSILGTFVNLIPISFVVVPVLATFGFLLFEKRSHLQPLFIALGLLTLFSLISFAGRVGEIFPSLPGRYFPELGMAIAFLSGILVINLLDFLAVDRKIGKINLIGRRRKILRTALTTVLSIVLLAVYLVSLRQPSEQLNKQVLGVWQEQFTVVGIGQIKEKTDFLDNLLGYSISIASLGFTTFLGIKIKRLEKSSHAN